MSAPELRLMAEYRAWPTWVDLDGGGVDNPDPHDLGLPGDLADALAGWSDDYDALWIEDDPGRGPQFADRATEVAFFARLHDLALRVAEAVGARYSVRVQDADNQWAQLS